MLIRINRLKIIKRAIKNASWVNGECVFRPFGTLVYRLIYRVGACFRLVLSSKGIRAKVSLEELVIVCYYANL